MARTSMTNSSQAIEKDEYFVENETPVGTLDGANKEFTLAYSPNPVISLMVFINGQKVTNTDEYTLSGDALTLTIAYPSGTELRVNYRRQPI